MCLIVEETGKLASRVVVPSWAPPLPQPAHETASTSVSSPPFAVLAGFSGFNGGWQYLAEVPPASPSPALLLCVCVLSGETSLRTFCPFSNWIIFLAVEFLVLFLFFF